MSRKTPDTSPRLILHIGAHKTGTSAIQLTLMRALSHLHEQGWAFAPQPNNGALNWNPMIGLKPGQDGGHFFLREPVLQMMIERIRQRGRHLIISSEDLFLLERDEIARFATEMKKLASRITVIAYLRRQDEMALSQWAQGAKTIQSATVFGCEESPLRPLTAQMRRYLDYAGRLDDWEAEFPDAEFITRVYDRRLFPDGDVVKDFVRVLGVDLNGVELPRDPNVSFGTSKNQFLYWLRGQGLTQPEIRKVIERNVVEERHDRLLPSRAEAEAFFAEFARSNARLAKRIGVKQVFSNDFSTYPRKASFRPMDPDYMLRNLMRLTLSLRKGLS